MPRGLPDCSNVVKEAPVFGLADMAELAARLGSPVNFTRYGDVFMLDDFEAGLQAWDANLYGVGSSVRPSGTFTRSHGVSMHMIGGTGADPYVKAWRGLPLPNSSKVGFSYAIMLGANLYKFRIGFVPTIGNLNYHFYVEYDHVDKKLRYKDDEGVYQPFADIDLRANNWPFHLVKLVVNFTTHEYERFLVNHRGYSLAGHLAEATGAAGQPEYFQAVIEVHGTALLSADAYIDDAVATQNEF